MQITKSHITHGLSIIVLLVSGPVFMMTTNPDTLPLALVMVPFLWLFATLFLLTWVAAGRSSFLSVHQRRVMLAGAVAALPTLLLVLASIHQLMWRDVLLVVGIVGVTVFYLSHADFIK